MFLKEKKLYLITIISFIALYLFDIGNIDALRQGTEGFYLLISQEMFSDGYFLTPRLVGGNHWSKPPFHFWLPMPLQLIFPLSYLTNARVSILLLSLGSMLYIAKWTQAHFKINPWLTFYFVFSSLGFLKYTRIYMMEMPFSLLTLLSCLIFYRAITVKSIKLIILSALISAMAILIKGPISLLICGFALLIFLLFSHFKKTIAIREGLKYLTLWSSISLSLGSLWFIYCYFQYGDEFYQYFFIRENMGKFTAKNYPISSVINGLLIYSFPLIFFLPKAIKNFSLKPLSQAHLFLISIFISFFFVWFIPSQKSHHYAIPALTPFLLLLLTSRFSSNEKPKGLDFNIINIFACLFIVLLIGISLIAINLELPSLENTSLFSFSFTILLSLSCLIVLFTTHRLWQYFSALVFIFAIIYIGIIPHFYLPVVPQDIAQQTQTKPVSVVFRKPFFIQEAVGKKVHIFSHDKIRQQTADQDHFFIVPNDVYSSQNLAAHTHIMAKWAIWKRGLKPKQIYRAVREKNIAQLLDYLLLLERRP